jgi:hypothetical protein
MASRYFISQLWRERERGREGEEEGGGERALKLILSLQTS